MLNWNRVNELVKQGNLAPAQRVEKSDVQWREMLTEAQYYITRQHGTEPPFSSDACGLHHPGLYACVCCGAMLFDARLKFDSGTGWPSFSQPIQENAIKYIADTQHGMQRIEVQCNVCDAHLGHVFPDGPPPSGLRYCINAEAMVRIED